MCTEVEQEFKKLWTKAGLEGLGPDREQPKDETGGEEEGAEESDDVPISLGYTEVQESLVPEEYNIFQGGPSKYKEFLDGLMLVPQKAFPFYLQLSTHQNCISAQRGKESP